MQSEGHGGSALQRRVKTTVLCTVKSARKQGFFILHDLKRHKISNKSLEIPYENTKR